MVRAEKTSLVESMVDVIRKVTLGLNREIESVIERTKQINKLSPGLQHHKLARKSVMKVMEEHIKSMPPIKIEKIRCSRKHKVKFKGRVRGKTYIGML